MSFVPVACPRCQSPRVDRLDATHYRCVHCQAMFVRDVPPGEMAPSPVGPPSTYVHYAPTPSSRAPLLIGIAAAIFFVLVGAGAVGAVLLRRPAPAPRPVTIDPILRPTTGTAATANAPERDAPLAPQARVKSFRKQASGSSTFWLVIYENSGTTTIRDPAARVSLFDATGHRVLEQPGYAKTKQLAPGETTPILVLAMSPPAFTRAEVAVVTPRAPSSYDTLPVPLEIVDFVPRKDNTFTKITGTVKNSSKQPVQFIEVVVTGVDASGEVVSLADGYATERQLAPGASTGFEITSGVFDVAPPTKYRVVASAMAMR
ncbi:MAG: hypothetical protein JWM74_4174 [Myxococcaceae bacterium]|nr:hypothetical protein [Myxococcaceae bacterium]